MDGFRSVKKDEVYTSEIVINKSRFLGFVKYVEAAGDAEAFLDELREKYKDARHICFAYKLQNSARASDDGEPAGTAGKPILNILEKRGLFNIIVVVVRYFGGIKLGAGGLLRAYSGSATNTLDNAQVVNYEAAKICEINLNYKDYQPFLNSIKGRKVKILATNFDNGASLTVVIGEEEVLDTAVEKEKIYYFFEDDK